jgi:hypothetical protein
MRKTTLRRHCSWNRYTVLRVVLALGSLVSMVLAAGAGGHWN